MSEPKPTGLIASVVGFVWKIVSWFFRKILWVASGFGAFGTFGGPNYHTDEVVLFNVNKAFFVWLPMVFGFISLPFISHGVAPGVFAWIFIAINIYVLLCILFNIDFMKLSIITGVVGLVWLFAYWLKSHEILLFSHIANYIVNINPKLDYGFVVAWSWCLFLIWVASIIHAVGYCRVIITSNSIEERHFGMGNEITDRMGLKFRLRYYDLLECILGLGSGTLEARRNDGSLVKKFDSILFQFFWAKRLDEILNQRTTIVDNSSHNPVDVEDIHHTQKMPAPTNTSKPDSTNATLL